MIDWYAYYWVVALVLVGAGFVIGFGFGAVCCLWWLKGADAEKVG